MKYYIDKKLAIGFDEAVSKVVEALKVEGFGVLAEINLHARVIE